LESDICSELKFLKLTFLASFSTATIGVSDMTCAKARYKNDLRLQKATL